MLQLRYLLPTSVQPTSDQLIRATDVDIDYYLFPGDVYFHVDNAVFDADWGWVPVLGFAMMFAEACRGIAEGSGETSVGFTESDARITLKRLNGKVAISANYTPAEAVVGLPELIDGSRSFLKTVYGDLMGRFPDLRSNEGLRNRIEQLLAP